MTHALIIATAMYVCSARNITGKYFSSTHASEAIAQTKALEKCQKHSMVCYSTGCKKAEKEQK